MSLYSYVVKNRAVIGSASVFEMTVLSLKTNSLKFEQINIY